VRIPDSIAEYLRLCGRPHNLRYVEMSVMLSYFMRHPSFGFLRALMAT